MAVIQRVDVHLPTTDGRTILLSRDTHPEPDHLLPLRQLQMELPRIAATDVAAGP
jgi:hypothetical protein